jgi:hypothetical protein
MFIGILDADFSKHKFPLQYWEVVSADFLSTQACTILTFVKDEDPSSSIVTTVFSTETYYPRFL